MEVASCIITTANVHDVKMLSIESFMWQIKGRLVGYKGYICPKKLLENLKNEQGIF